MSSLSSTRPCSTRVIPRRSARERCSGGSSRGWDRPRPATRMTTGQRMPAKAQRSRRPGRSCRAAPAACQVPRPWPMPPAGHNTQGGRPDPARPGSAEGIPPRSGPRPIPRRPGPRSSKHSSALSRPVSPTCHESSRPHAPTCPPGWPARLPPESVGPRNRRPMTHVHPRDGGMHRTLQRCACSRPGPGHRARRHGH